MLGSLLIDPGSFVRVSPLLAAEQFYWAKNASIYRAMARLDQRREPLDYLTLTTELERENELAAVGGGAYISQLINSVPSAINIESYARLVAASSVRRELLQAASDIAQRAYDESIDIHDVVDKAEAAVFGVRPGRLANNPQHVSDIATSYYDELTGEKPFLLDTGYPTLDAVMGGLRPGAVHIIASRPAVGKSVLLTNLADKAAIKFGRTVLFFTLEMSAEELYGRILTAHGALSALDLRNGRVPPLRATQVMDGIQETAGMPLWIDTTPYITIQSLRSKTRRRVAEFGLDVLFIDYVQLLRTSDVKASATRQQYIGAIMRDLKGLARELNIPVVVAAQLNRDADDQRPTLRMLRESGDIENDADIVMFLWVPRAVEQGRLRPTQLYALKNRQGENFSITLAFDPQRVAFVPLARKYEAEEIPTHY